MLFYIIFKACCFTINRRGASVMAGSERLALELRSRIKLIRNTHTRPSTETNKDVFSWLEKSSNKKFFCWIHYFDIHSPYKPDYDSSVTLADNALGKLKDKRDV